MMRNVTMVPTRLVAVLAPGAALLAPELTAAQDPTPPPAEAPRLPTDSAEAILRRFAEDYERDPSLKKDVTFGISLDEHALWHVVARAASDGHPAEVEVRRGEPPIPTFTFFLHYPTLVRIDRGEISASTAMVRGLASDPALMSTSSSDGFEITPEAVETLLDVTSHFWTRGFPEVIPFGEEHARMVHGADAVVLHYRPGFRSGWFSLGKGQHANADPRLQVNPFPTLLVITRGTGRGRIGGEELELGAGHAIFIPAGTSHEFWNPYEEPVEGLILMFGEGA